MNLSVRRMTVADIPQCHALPLTDSFAYSALCHARMPDFWKYLLTRGYVDGFVFEDFSRPRTAQIVAFVLIVIIDDAFAEEAVTTLPPYFSAQIVERWMAGRSPLLDLEAVRDANSGAGVNLTIFQAGVVGGYFFTEENHPVRMGLLEVYMNRCRGYRLKQILIEVTGKEHLQWNQQGGFRLRRDYEEFWAAGFPARHPAHSEPYLVGLNREEASSLESAAASAIFSYVSPWFFFQPKEQELINAALIGLSDEEAASTLCISHSAIRKRWEDIYAKVTKAGPTLLNTPEDNSAPRTGAQKKRRLLSYLRDHPEELRPVMMPKSVPEKALQRLKG